MSARFRGGGAGAGGVIGYPLDEIYREVAFLAYHVSWSHEEILNLEHVDRRRWVSEVSDINRQINEDA